MAASQVPTKCREERDALGCGYLNVIAKSLTFSPSIVSYAGEQGAEKQFQTPFHSTVRHCEMSFLAIEKSSRLRHIFIQQIPSNQSVIRTNQSVISTVAERSYKMGINLAISLSPHRRRPLSFGLAQKKQKPKAWI